MKILHVTSSFKPAWETGGVNRAAYEISKNLAKRGHEVTVFTTDRGRTRVKVQKNQPVIVDRIRVYYFSNISNYLAMKKKVFTPYYLPFIARREIKQFDIIHIHEHRTPLAVIIHHYARKFHIPYALQAHGSVATYFQKGTLKRIFDRLWGYKILRDASKLIALTLTEAEQYKSMGVSERRIEIVPVGIDLAEFENLPQRGEFRRKYGLNDNQKIVLYLGRIHNKEKGLDLLAKAFAGLTKESDDMKLAIVGPDDGSLLVLKELTKQLRIEENVLFTGPLYGEEKLEAYVDADVFVTPSFSGFPATFLEACACGLPIVITENGDNLSWIHNQVGFVATYSESSLRGAIAKLLENPGLAWHFRQKGKTLVKEQFNWSRITERLELIYLDAKHGG